MTMTDGVTPQNDSEAEEAEAALSPATVADKPDDVFTAYAATGHSPLSPEARRLRARHEEREANKQSGRWRERWESSRARVAPGTRPFEIGKRVIVGTYYDGFIHAGNLAYLALIALFPFFITAMALFSAFGQGAEGARVLDSLLAQMPPNVGRALVEPLHEVLQARTGPLLWIGALVGLWTVGSLIETIRDILRRAYGTQLLRPFWEYRLGAIGVIFGAVVLLLFAFSFQVLVTGIDEFVERILPDGFDTLGTIAVGRALTALVLFVSTYLLFYSLTPPPYRRGHYPKWPGALFITIWSVSVTMALPWVLATLFSYDLTYGSLAGVMVALFYFYLLGLGIVMGAELNAALAESPQETHDWVGQEDNRSRKSPDEPTP